ncbi:hypothetical protein [Phormidium sp. CCY1219]|jgi:hypothetical protein|uniref:hypothetical protein n=1 Tax=Phormidium sp. CCY1219 TaxID=2886104 RepID=UPI002D1ED317|nr:hypothetical protein [Phormidium sp. CCY1219]MEB3828166.1 hypothetical protein [Phormidium sp. CCY1219]
MTVKQFYIIPLLVFLSLTLRVNMASSAYRVNSVSTNFSISRSSESDKEEESDLLPTKMAQVFNQSGAIGQSVPVEPCPAEEGEEAGDIICPS